jgi:glucan phosphoethanolaminetransferase (alkaline phosphatase superfamily)
MIKFNLATFKSIYLSWLALMKLSSLRNLIMAIMVSYFLYMLLALYFLDYVLMVFCEDKQEYKYYDGVNLDMRLKVVAGFTIIFIISLIGLRSNSKLYRKKEKLKKILLRKEKYFITYEELASEYKNDFYKKLLLEDLLKKYECLFIEKNDGIELIDDDLIYGQINNNLNNNKGEN